MRNGRFWVTLTAACAVSGIASPVSAQEIGSTAPAILAKDPEYRQSPIRVGPFTLKAGAEAEGEYNSNVFAEPVAARSDFIARIRPYAEIEHAAGSFTTSLSGKLDARRYADFTSENAEAYNATLTTRFSPREGEALFLTGSIDRAIEDRGDPEARRVQGIGPRIYRIAGGSAGYTRQGSRFLIEAVGDARNVNALDPIDDDRDYSSYSARLTVGYRPGGPFYFTGTGYYNRLNFRLPVAVTNVDRDVSTIGGMVGIRFADGGLISGGVSAGIFRLKADDDLRPDRTGFSMQGLLTYRPRERTALNLNLFSGDVASFRAGGSTRNETRIGLSVDQEIRHNLLGSAEIGWERTKFVGSNIRQDRVRVGGGLEYLVNRRLSVFGRASYGTRSSDDPLDEYNRFQAGVGVRVRL